MEMQLQSALLSELPGLRHGFTTRHGGVSTGPLSTLNLALRQGQDPEGLVENWTRVLHPLDPAALAIADQVHADEVIRVQTGAGPLDTVGAADALITDRPGVPIAVRTADCVPILLAAPGAVAAVHAGWRGTTAPIIPPAVAALCELAGCPPSELRAAIGPCISLASYEVGPEVVRALTNLDLHVCVDRSATGRTHVDLARANRLLLHRVGVQRVEVLGHCTLRDDRFYSHRGQGPSTGRQAAWISLC
ncbi:MAG: polyphenol oxidase family protein [Myxococcota bacterium]|nr:polyphenol oxidase family protein [Myxococcota bacterium]